MSHQTVLIADDEEAIGFALAREVRRHGLVPLVAADGRSAVALVSSAGETLIAGILDVRMPHLDGVSAARAVLEVRPGTPLALMTAFDEDRLPAPLETVIRMFTKPFALGTFAEWLASVRSERAPSSAAGHVATPTFIENTPRARAG